MYNNNRNKKESQVVLLFLLKITYSNILLFLESECEYVQWFNLSKTVCNTADDILLCAVYAPPKTLPIVKIVF